MKKIKSFSEAYKFVVGGSQESEYIYPVIRSLNMRERKLFLLNQHLSQLFLSGYEFFIDIHFEMSLHHDHYTVFCKSIHEMKDIDRKYKLAGLNIVKYCLLMMHDVGFGKQVRSITAPTGFDMMHMVTRRDGSHGNQVPSLPTCMRYYYREITENLVKAHQGENTNNELKLAIGGMLATMMYWFPENILEGLLTDLRVVMVGE